MKTQRFVNTFAKGMWQDIDNLQMQKESYLYALNGRVTFNIDGTYAFQNANGTLLALNINANYNGTGKNTYYPIGGVELNSKLILFLTNGVNSEIGLVTESVFDSLVYQTMYNDLYDPFGDKLNFSAAWPMRDFEVVQENSITENVYFNDYHNEPRAFNILLGARPVVYNNVTYFVTPYAPPYPPYYSAHGMAQMIDLTWGLMKFKRQITGELLSGQYQYAYRYIHKTQYASPWSPLTGPLFLTKDPIDSTNWTKYQMEESAAQTSKGIQLELTHIDQRFQQVEVAALYWETGAAPNNAYTFFKGSITGASMIIDHQFAGASIDPATLVQRFTEISKAKTGNLKDNVRHLANYSVFPNLEIDTAGITLTPYGRPMLSDETTEPPGDNIPFTNQTPKGSYGNPDTVGVSIADNFNSGNTLEYYDIAFDYINYKGMQWAHLFKGDFGGEIYPFAIVVFDRKGQPFFAQHISDFTFPQRYSNQWFDNRLSGQTSGTTGNVGDWRHTNSTSPATTQITTDVSTDAWWLNLMGLKISGIDLGPILRDSDGKLQISGFSIVRTDRIKQILGQGLITSTGDTIDRSNSNQLVTALPTMFNGFVGEVGTGKPYNVSPYEYATTNFTVVGRQRQISSADVWQARPNIGGFESPDYMIDNARLSNFSTGDVLKVVDVCVKAYALVDPGNIPDSIVSNEPYQLAGNHNSYYQKNYRTTFSGLITPRNVGGIMALGDDVTITNWYPNIQPGQVLLNTLIYNSNPETNDYLNWGLTKNYKAFSSIEPTILFTTPSTWLGVLTDNGIGSGAYFIANYIRPIGGYTITEALLQNRVYDNVGHFVPVNEEILTNIFNAQGNYIFNNVEVWGGDCYLDYWTYYRLYADLEQLNNNNNDYSIGLSFPVESEFNIAMRQGNTYERFGPKPAATYYGQDTVFSDGLYWRSASDEKLETFAVNSVLQLKDTIDTYPAKPATFIEVYDYPVNEIHTGTKIYGEQFDTWRLFPVNNIQSADGSKGQINSMQSIFDNLYIIQETGLARMRFNDREQTAASTGGSIILSTNSGYQGHDYISYVSGTQHQFSVVNSGKALYFVDANKGDMVRFGQDGFLSVSDLHGMHNFFVHTPRKYWNRDNPVLNANAGGGGILGTFDFKNKSVYYTFTNVLDQSDHLVQGQTVEFNQEESQYKGFHSFIPQLYFQLRGNSLSVDPLNKYRLYMHDEGMVGNIYGVFTDSILRFAANPSLTEPAWFDNGRIALNNNAASVKMSKAILNVADYATQTVNFPLDNRWKYRQGYLEYCTRAQGANTRLRGKYMTIDLTITNDSSNTVVRITDHATEYRPSPRL